MATSKPSKDSFSNENTRICRNCLSTDGTLQSVTADERGEYLSQQVFSFTNVQMELLPGSTAYLCSACKSRLNLADKRRSIYTLNIAKLDRIIKEVDPTHLTGFETTAQRSDGVIEQTDDVKSVVKTKVASEGSEEDYQLSQTVSNSQQMNSAYDYNLLNDLFEAEEESLETILKREPIDDQQQPQSPQANLIQEEVSMVGKATTGPDDPASISDHNNLGIKYATEGLRLNQMDTYGEQKSGHTGNQPVSVIGEQRLLRSNKRRSSQKDIAAAEFSMATMHSPKVTRNVHKNKQKHQYPHCSVTYPNTSKLKIHIRTHNRKKPFICKVCSKAFHSENTLIIHMKIHNKDQHKCPHCPGKFARPSQLKDHIRIHTGEKPFHCNVCSKKFHAARNLHIHMKIHNKDQHKCPHCPGKFARPSQLKDHIRTHTGEKPFICKVCSKAFHSASALCIHKTIHNKDQHNCPHCSSEFALQTQLEKHIRIHTGEKPFHCKVCSKEFHSAVNLYNHMKIHAKAQQCPYCDRKFALQYQLKTHIRIHTGEKPFHCNVCSKKFHAVINLHNHMKIHNKDQHKCPHCPGKFAWPSQLKDHIRTHTGEKPFICKVCSKAFHTANILRYHIKIHNKDQHKCPHCPGKFARQSQLEDHIRIHTGEKPFHCKVCSKEFHSAVNLYTHMKIHDKAQQCPYCDSKFAQQTQLKTHIRIHTGEKPFTCKVCSKAFHSANTLIIHMKIHNKDQHKCPHCPRKFPLQYQLKNHIRTHTDEKPFTCKVCSKAFHSAKSLCGHMKIHKPPAPTGENS